MQELTERSMGESTWMHPMGASRSTTAHRALTEQSKMIGSYF